MKKKFLFRIHSVAGLVSGLFILLLSLSGAALVFHDELDALQQPTVLAQKRLSLLSIDSCYSILQQNYPHAQISNCNIAESSTKPFSFSIYDSTLAKGTAGIQVFLHPQTGAILKTRGGSNDINHNFMSWLSAFHSSFHLHKSGEWMLGFFAIVFLISLVSGMILYRKNIWSVLTFKKNDLHQLIGVYALLFNLMIAFTGFWMQRYVFKKEFYSASNYIPVIKRSPPLTFKFNSAFNNIEKKFPGFTSYVIYFAQSKKGNTAVYGSRKSNSFIHSKKFADAILLDSTGNIASTRFVNEISPGDRYDIISSQIHFGKYGGLPVKIMYSLLGLASALLSITGFILWLRRKK